jgi:hypothetical protein
MRLLAPLLGFLLLCAPATAQPQHPTHDEHEEHEFDAFEGASPDVALAARLVLMKGHLRIGRELYDAGDRDTASGHFLHPLVELHGDVEPALQQRKLKPIKADLEALGEAPEKGEAAVRKAYDRARGAIDRALAEATKPVRRSPAESYDVFLRIARQAAHEYGNGIEEDKFFAPVEYQDGRGFLLAGRDALKGFEKPLAAKSAEGYRALTTEYRRMLQAFPTAHPPQRVKTRPEELEASVKRIEDLRSRFE